MRPSAWILAAALSAAVSFSSAGPGEGHLVLLHTNDVHGQARPRAATWLGGEDPPLVGGLPRLAAAVRSVREEVGAENVLLVDGGDWSQGTPEGLVDEGRVFVAAMAAVGYDAMCVGNHELDHGVASLIETIREAKVPAVLANVRDKEGDRVDWAPPYRVFERAGLKVAVVGLVTQVTPSITHSDAKEVTFCDPAEELLKVREELGDEVDLVIPATHLGVGTDRELARAHPDLVFIAGGHSHTFLREGVLEGEVQIGQVGSKASAYGRLDLWFDTETKRVTRREYRVTSLMEEPSESARVGQVEELCAALEVLVVQAAGWRGGGSAQPSSSFLSASLRVLRGGARGETPPVHGVRGSWAESRGYHLPAGEPPGRRPGSRRAEPHPGPAPAPRGPGARPQRFAGADRARPGRRRTGRRRRVGTP